MYKREAQAVLTVLENSIPTFKESWAKENGHDVNTLSVSKLLEGRPDGWVPGFRINQFFPDDSTPEGVGVRILAEVSPEGFLRYLVRRHWKQPRIGLPEPEFQRVSVAVHDWGNGTTVYAGKNEASVRRQLDHDLKSYWEAKPWFRGQEYPGIEEYFDPETGCGEEEGYVIHNDVEVI